MRCIISNCNHDSSQTSPEITYHKFPTEPSLRAAWLEALHMVGWVPEEHSVVCSNHFDKQDLLMNSNGYCVVRSGAVPVVDVRACRICFATDGKLYPIAAYNVLSKSYETLTGLLIHNAGNLPRYLCSECARRMMNYARFRIKTLGAHSILTDIIKNHGFITLELMQSVRGVQYPLNLNQTDYDLDIELAQKANIYTNVKVGNSSITNLGEHTAIEAIKAENYDMINQDILSTDDSATDAVVCISSLAEVITANSINSENNFETDQYHTPNVDSTIVNMKHGDTFIGKDYSPYENLQLAEATQNTKPTTTQGEQEMIKEQKDLAVIQVDTNRKPEVDGGLLLNSKLCCSMCSYQTSTELQLYSHYKAHAAPASYSCNMCSYITIHRTSLKYHVKIHSADKSYSCNTCHKTFNVKAHLTKHMTVHCGVQQYMCDICNKSFNHRSNITKHLKTHSGVKPYLCDVCYKVFSQKSHLTVHLRAHYGLKPYSCEICNKVFRYKTDLTKHRTIHSGEKPHSCHVCNKVFNRKGYLTIHLRTHSGEKPYSCNICSKQFISKGDLNKHFRIHTGIKPYTCYTCNKAFTQKATLTKHLRTHSGEKPYPCNVCNKVFSQKPHLTAHLKTHTDV